MSKNTYFSYINLLKISGVSSFLQDSPNNYYKKIKNDEKNSSKDSINKLSHIETLNELEQYIKNSNNCSLKKIANKTVFSDGNPQSKIMLIGEAPGAEEDKLGKPFVGSAGKLLDKMLQSINLNRNLVYITNVIPWRPPNNRTPNSEEIIQCLPFIQKHIEIIQPLIMILLGGTAAKAIMVTNYGIMKTRGKWQNYNSINLKNSIPCIATYHPAFLLRSPKYKKESWEDLKKIEKKIKSYEIN